MNDIGTIELYTDNLILRRINTNESDINDLYNNITSDDNIMGKLSKNTHTNIDETTYYVQDICQRYESENIYYWVIELKGNSHIIGYVHGEINHDVESVCLSFCIGQNWQNKRYMQEAVRRITNFLIKDICINRIEGFTDATNNRAGKVFIRCGFSGEGVLRKNHRDNNGKITNLLCFAYLRDDYLRKESMKKMNLTIDNLYITNYCESGGKPLRSIMRLSNEERKEVCKELSENSTSRNDRYGYYFDRYYEKRKATEEWLYNEFIRVGGNPATRHPIYFVLTENENFQKFYGNEKQVSIPIKDIPSKNLALLQETVCI